MVSKLWLTGYIKLNWYSEVPNCKKKFSISVFSCGCNLNKAIKCDTQTVDVLHNHVNHCQIWKRQYSSWNYTNISLRIFNEKSNVLKILRSKPFPNVFLSDAINLLYFLLEHIRCIVMNSAFFLFSKKLRCATIYCINVFFVVSHFRIYFSPM